MSKSIDVGIVFSVNASKVEIKMFKESSDFKYFYNGVEYEGIRMGGFLSIARGYIDIICQIESEEIRDKYIKTDNVQDHKQGRYERYVTARCIGYFENEKFNTGSKFLPIIYNNVSMLSDKKISKIISSNKSEGSIDFIIGNDLRYNLELMLPFEKIFNTHIGIFGNTGSGKSNTLVKLYSTLLNHSKLSVEKSKFIFIDFNGEYIGEEVIKKEKKVYNLSTLDNSGEKYKIESDFFWNEEVLSILFHATEKTQKPFLKRVVEGKKKYGVEKKALKNYIKKTYEKIFTTTSPKKDTLPLIQSIFEEIGFTCEALNSIEWQSNTCKFKLDKEHINGGNLGDAMRSRLKIDDVDFNSNFSMSELKILKISAKLSLINGLILNINQFEHINPLISKIESVSISIEKVISIVQSGFKLEKTNNIEIVSLRDCNQEIKKIIPMLLAKKYFEKHKEGIDAVPLNKTFHLIIDEAHNILSNQSKRESESWKDYRLELFEEIIKEGRKFGFFLTVSSQRPADISETIISQFHNFFIHRLINEKDLRLIDNVISTLDATSKQMIPTLPKGACIVTGTAFDLPQLIQVDYIKDGSKRPNSDDIDLLKIWKIAPNE